MAKQHRLTSRFLMPVAIAMLAATAFLWGPVDSLHASIVSYQSGVAATSGAGPAADPTTQGWAFSGLAGNQFSSAYDSGDGGWRTVDGTNSGPAFESEPFSAAAVTTLTTRAWEMTTTFSMDSDAIGSAGGFVADYYESRTDDDIRIFLQTSSFSYVLNLVVDPTSPHDLFLHQDGGGPVIQLTNDGSGFDVFHDLALRSGDGGGTAGLYFDGGFVTTLSSIGTGPNRAVFGASSSNGQGSAIWNNFEINVIPEPSTFVLSLTGLVAIFGVRWRRRGSR